MIQTKIRVCLQSGPNILPLNKMNLIASTKRYAYEFKIFCGRTLKNEIIKVTPFSKNLQ